jgi:hypothetical protein
MCEGGEGGIREGEGLWRGDGFRHSTRGENGEHWDRVS